VTASHAEVEIVAEELLFVTEDGGDCHIHMWNLNMDIEGI
jgi:hypothetical protein